MAWTAPPTKPKLGLCNRSVTKIHSGLDCHLDKISCIYLLLLPGFSQFIFTFISYFTLWGPNFTKIEEQIHRDICNHAGICFIV